MGMSCTTATVSNFGPTNVEVNGAEVKLSSTDKLQGFVTRTDTFSTDPAKKTWSADGGWGFGLIGPSAKQLPYGRNGHLANQIDVCARQLQSPAKEALNNVARRLRDPVR